MISEHFLIKKPTLAVVELDGYRIMMYIAAGDTVVVVNDLLDSAGLVNVKWDDRTAFMFDSDLRERAELVRVAGAAL